LSKGRVEDLGFQIRLDFFVARETQPPGLQVEQIFVLGRVGGMARQTSLWTQDRFVAYGHLGSFIRVTLGAQLIAPLSGKMFELRRMGQVACSAHPLLEWDVLHGPPRLERGGIMAIGA
jgi:hypothetical protein